MCNYAKKHNAKKYNYKLILNKHYYVYNSKNQYLQNEGRY